MHSDLETLYDAHAPRLYAYCWSLVGDEAPEAMKDTFTAIERLGPPRGDEVLWLHAIARTACMRRGALGGSHSAEHDPDPLRRAAAGLRSDHREVLLLSAGVWLEPHAIARLLGVAYDTVLELLQTARARFEKAVLETLLRRPMSMRYDDVIAAFERGRLPALLARRVPTEPPAGLRAEVLGIALPGDSPDESLQVTAPGTPPSVDPRHRFARRTKAKGAAEAGAIAACAAAAAGLLVAWAPSVGKSTGPDNGVSAALPEVHGGGTGGSNVTGGGGTWDAGNPQVTPSESAPAPTVPTSGPLTEVTEAPAAGGGSGTSRGTGRGTGEPSAPAPAPSVPDRQDPAPQPEPRERDLGETLEDTVGGLGDAVGDTVGGPVGDVLGDTTGAVGDTVGGTVGGLLP